MRLHSGHYTKEFCYYLRNTKAVSALEYAILVGVVVAGIGAAVAAFVEDVDTLMGNLGANITSTQAPTAPTTEAMTPETGGAGGGGGG